jgi:ATP-dependent Clp protease ATP-binding subunit ClpB
VDFKNTVIILTSNLGSAQIQALDSRTDGPREAHDAAVRKAVLEEARRVFRPEFLNRLDDLVVFRSLGKGEIRRVVDIQLARFEERMEARDLRLDVSAAAKEALADAGWDPQYGARPLKRAIQHNLEDPLARAILAGEFPPGTRVVVDCASNGELRFHAGLAN